jgi:hypothetical protein
MTEHQPLHWRPSPLALALATSSATALALAILLRRAELVAFAAPLLGALVRVRATGLATGVVVRADRATERCFAGDAFRCGSPRGRIGPATRSRCGSPRPPVSSWCRTG